MIGIKRFCESVPMIATIAFLARYPVKGLSAEALDAATLTAGAHFPGDRLYAIENGPSGFDPAAPVHQPKIKYLTLMKNADLARFQTHYDDGTRVLTLRQKGQIVASGDLGSEAGRRGIEAFFATTFAAELRGPPKILAAPAGYRFMDSSRSGFVSILNLASVAALAAKAGRRTLDPVRFRANIGIAGLPPWGEFDLVGRDIRIGTVLLRVLKPIDRCAATQVDPATGQRDIDMVGLLERDFGHNDCGIYAEVIASGTISTGDALLPA